MKNLEKKPINEVFQQDLESSGKYYSKYIFDFLNI
jgi:hypothetical protein